MEVLSYSCVSCKKDYVAYKNLWAHNKSHHNGIKTIKVVYKPDENDTLSFKCRKCNNVYKHAQSRHTHEKSCGGIVRTEVDLEFEKCRAINLDKEKENLAKENENLEKIIKLQDLKNIEIANKRAIFESRGLYTSNVNTETTEHFIYMICEREFMNDNVYKIGRSNMTKCTRSTKYPKGSQMISLNSCIDSIKFEYILIQLFKFKFIQETEYGTEYFRGEIQEMKNEVLKLLLDESKGYSNGENIASLQFKIQNNKELKERKLPQKEILELKELLNGKIIALANKEWS